MRYWTNTDTPGLSLMCAGFSTQQYAPGGWDRVIPFFAFPPTIRKIVKTCDHFPSDEAATRLIWLALHTITAGCGRAAHDGKAAMNPFAILYEERFARPSV